MRNLWWICWYLWEGLPTLLAFPIDSSKPSGTGESWFLHWEDHWPRYTIGTLGFVVVAFTLAGCLCCRRQRRPKGFQDDAGNGKEFKDGSTAGTETTIERHPSASLELEVPRIASSSLTASNKMQFEALPIDRFAADSRLTGKPKPPSPSLFSDEQEIEKNFLREEPCREWFEAGNCHVPRERLKYLREIGRGWFGKVVEGTTESPDNSTKNRGVVVRILTEEATTKEKAWFLGEATPYLKLQHPNILTLLGSCLETDPYLLLFESCPAGDLKGFLRSNRDKGTCEALRKENIPTRMALDIAKALEHMHENGFAHTDLSARNCLVSPDLSAKLGDYGTGVERYPGDYYVVGDRALPIRWSAPESLECTATTIETRAITPRANLWSYGVLLWEMATWGERPYDDLGDEQVIEMIFSLKTGFSPHGNSLAMLKKLRDEQLDVPGNFSEAVEALWKFFPDDRASLKETREIICGKRIEDFEKRWENLRPNGANVEARERENRSASLRDLRGSVENELFFEEKNSSAVQAQFRLGPDEPVKNLPCARQSAQESGSETEEESWRGRVERGAYTEKVKQKSKSVADLMVLVHIDSDSDAEISLGPQNTEKSVKKRLPASGSDGDLRSTVLADEFDEAIRKLREPSVCNGTTLKTTKSPLENLQSTDNLENPKLLTLTQQGQTPILRLSFGTPENVSNSTFSEKIENRLENFSPQKNILENVTTEFFDREKSAKILSNVSSSSREEKWRIDDLVGKTANSLAASPKAVFSEKQKSEDSVVKLNSNAKIESPRIEGHVLRLVSKGDPDLPLLRYVPERASTLENPSLIEETPRFDSFLVFEPQDTVACFSNNFEASRVNESSVDVELWNNALAYELEKKTPGYDVDATIFDNYENSTEKFDDSGAAGKRIEIPNYKNDEIIERSSSVPNTPKIRKNFPIQSASAPDTPRNYYRGEIDEDLINGSSSAAPYSVGNLDEDSSTGEDLEASERMLKGSASAPDTPQSRGNYSVGNGDEDSSTGEELETGMIKRSSHEADDEEDRKHLSTPDDERSSDSGFRDKESCEEEESPVPCPTASSIILSNTISSSGLATSSSPLSASAEEEQMRILFELDTILDAEYYGSFHDSDKLDDREILSPSNIQVRFVESEEIGGKNRSISESLESTESTDIVETVRANSCEPAFLDSRSSRDIGHEEELRTLGDFLKNEGKDDVKNSLEICDGTEADSMSECSMKTDHNQSVETSAQSNLRQNLSADSEKNHSSDSSVELRRLNVDSSSSQGKFDKSNESTDLSVELRSSDKSSPREDFEKPTESSPICDSADLADSNSESPLKSDKNPSTDFSLDLRLNDGSEICKASEIESSDSTSQSPLKTDQKSEDFDKPSELENLTSDSAKAERKTENVSEKLVENSEICEQSETELENSTSDSPLKTDRCQTSDFSMETRGADSVHSDVEQWSSRENINDNDDEDSSTMSLRSDNSYVSFGLDEEFVAAIRNELREKLPRAQMPVVEALDPRDEKEPSINEDVETKRWEDEETEENLERGSGGVDISIRYNIYGTPLSPILEERESAGTSESLVSKEDSRDASIASRVSALSEDVLVVDTRTNRAMMLEGTGGNGESSNLQQDDDRDTSHGDFSDEENLEYPQNNLNRGMESKRITMGSGGAPLPSPEEESKWQQQFPLPLQMQDDLMSTSFGTDRDWDSQDEDEGEDDGEDGEEDEEENSSSSGEFVWKRYDESHGDLENVATRSPPNKPKSQEPEADLDEEDEGDEDDEEEEEEFTPSAWDATLAPHRSALRSPEKTLKSGDQKKSVWFKKQRYHCVYEYPKETPVTEGQGQAATTWEPTSYADWEEMMDEPRLDVYPIEYDETNRAGDEEFYVSSSNRPFQFQSGEGKYVSQFFPGASSTLLQQQQPSREGEDCQESQDEVDRVDVPVPQPTQTNGNARGPVLVDNQQQIQQTQLGELRHTRDRLKLNLLLTSGASKMEEDVGIENRTLDVEEIENSDKEISRTLQRQTEAPVNEESSKTAEKLLKDNKSVDLKTVENEIVETPSKETTKSLEEKSEDKKLLQLNTVESEVVENLSKEMTKWMEEKSEDKKLLDLKTVESEIVENLSKEPTESLEEKGKQNKLLELNTAETEIVEDSSKKTLKLVEEKCEENQRTERPMKEESSKTAKELSEYDEKSIESTIREKNRLKTENIELDFNESQKSSSPKNRDNLAVREASKIEKNKQLCKNEDGTVNTFSSDDLAVIQGNDEIDGVVEASSSKEDSRSIGDQKDSSKSKIVDATSEFVAGQIVDITKLETEESLSIAQQHIERNSVIVEKSENTEGASVRDANVVPSMTHSSNEKTDEDVVQWSQS